MVGEELNRGLPVRGIRNLPFVSVKKLPEGVFYFQAFFSLIVSLYCGSDIGGRIFLQNVNIECRGVDCLARA